MSPIIKGIYLVENVFPSHQLVSLLAIIDLETNGVKGSLLFDQVLSMR